MSFLSIVSRMLAAAGALCLPVAAFAQKLPSVEEAGRRAVTRLDLQTEIPNPQVGWDLNLPAIALSDGLLWTALAIGVAIALYAARDDLPRLIFGQSKRWQDTGAEEIGVGTNVSPAEAALTADELASHGHFREAMHVLLLRAIAEMRERLGTEFARSLTSREILRRANLPETSKTSLRDIITRVELSYFGDYPVAADDYAACRHSFEQLMGLLGHPATRA